MKLLLKALLDCRCKNGIQKTSCEQCKERIASIICPIEKAIASIKAAHDNSIRECDQMSSEQLIERNMNLKNYVYKLEERINEENTQSNCMQKDLQTIQNKLQIESEKIKEVHKSRLEIEAEIKKLSDSLKTEVRKLVEQETNQRKEAEVTTEEISSELYQLKKQLYVQISLNRDIRKKISNTVPEEIPFYKLEFNLEPSIQSSESSSYDSAFDESDSGLIDDFQLEQFEQFLKECMMSPLKKLLQTSFLKNCLSEDIIPCLNFNSNSKIPLWTIINSIIGKNLKISNNTSSSIILNIGEETDSKIIINKKGIWGTFNVAIQNISPGSPKKAKFKGCQACGQQILCQYYLSLNETHINLPIDNFCHDRIATCIDFFNFISDIQSGKCNSKNIEELFSEMLNLKLRMFYARLGFLPSVGIEIARSIDCISFPSEDLAPMLQEIDISRL